MKTFKKIMVVAIIVTFAIPVFNGCKKGDGDPWISFRSRKTRVVGQWTICQWKEEIKSTKTSSIDTTYVESSKTEINGSNVTITASEMQETYYDTTGYNIGQSGNATATLIFYNDGTFLMTFTYKNLNASYANLNSNQRESYVYSQTRETSGTWDFLSGYEQEYKNKERIILNTLKFTSNFNLTTSYGDVETGSSTHTYLSGERSEIWHIYSLKNKEIVIDANINNVYSSNTNIIPASWGSLNSANSESSTETGTLNCTLIQ